MKLYRKMARGVTGRKAALLAAAMASCVIGGCGRKQPAPAPVSETTVEAVKPTEVQGMPNPMKEVENVLAFEAIGVHMVLPEEAGDASCFIINGEVADVRFTLDGAEYTYRASGTAEDFAGVFDRFKDGEAMKETAGSGEQAAEIEIKTTESGGRLAAWEWGSTKYTLYTPSQVEDADISGLAVTLAELGENEK